MPQKLAARCWSASGHNQYAYHNMYSEVCMMMAARVSEVVDVIATRFLGCPEANVKLT